MTYEYGTLRPPTPVEMEARYIPLETIKVKWLDAENWQVRNAYEGAYEGMGEASDDVWEGAVAELAEFMKEHCIPVDAKLVYHECGRHQMALDWTQLELCEVCNQWREPHSADDEFHVLMQRASDAWKSRSGFCELCKLTVVNMESHEEQPFHKGREKRRAETAS